MYGLYIHVPYCRSRCRYCDFYTCGAAKEVPSEYIDALQKAFSMHAPIAPSGKKHRPSTLYFGGGTPSLLSPMQVETLIEMAKPLPNAEITLEANPESLSLEKLIDFRKAGVNRLSLGVQTASDESLATLGRLHTAAEARIALDYAKKAGFDNVSGDVMLALPSYTMEEMRSTVNMLAEGGVKHVSAYLLKIEPNTAFGKSAPAALPSADESADFYFAAAEMLESLGYMQYEISNFAKEGYTGRHNLLYWNCEDYLGLGPGAHSCMGDARFSFAPSTGDFLAGSAGMVAEGECTADDFVMLQLRLTKGLCEDELKERFGVGLSAGQKNEFDLLQRHGLALHQKGSWRLTREGMLVQNSILARLL